MAEFDLGKTDGTPTGDTKMQQIRNELAEQGWTPINFGFSLARKNGAVDMERGSQRVLIYSSDLADQQARALFEQHSLPTFHVLNDVPEPGDSGSHIIVLDIPTGTQALDSMVFREDGKAVGYLGAVEILERTAELLARIYKATSSVPEGLNLNRLALLTRTNEIIRLVPPVTLIPSSDWRVLVEQLKADLMDQDPINAAAHKAQMDYFIAQFEKTLGGK